MIALLLACSKDDPAAPGTTATAPTVTTPEGIPWVLETTEPSEVDLPAALAAAQAGIELAVQMTPDPVLDAYFDLMGAADASCPARYEVDGLEYWLDSCTASTGAFFDGFSLEDEELVVDPYGTTSVVATTGGAAWIEDRDGTYLELDGAAQLIATEFDGIVAQTLVLVGRFSTNHPAAAGTWIEAGLRPTFIATTYDVGPMRIAFAAVGAIDGFAGDFTAVAFDDAALVDDALGYGGCTLEPTGVVSVRLADGSWVDVVFDPYLVDDVIQVEPGLCDGCGRAWHRDEDLGEVCLDFSSWL